MQISSCEFYQNFFLPGKLSVETHEEEVVSAMAEDYLSERNTYAIDVDDPNVAMLGYSKFCINLIYKSFFMFGN